MSQLASSKSAVLSPQFVADALGTAADKLKIHFIDNTDPDGMDRVFSNLGNRLGTTLVVVTSKSGSTPEPRNGLIESELVWKKAGLNFSAHAVAVTGEGSQLDQIAVKEKWLARFPMWDWVGGRTSELGPVGLLPAALQGIDINALLVGAKKMDELTREKNAEKMKKLCPLCGEEVVNRYHNAKHCFECMLTNANGSKKAGSEVAKAIKRGDLPPVKTLLCVDCGKPAQSYEHRDYNKPLDVSPVCRSCNYFRGPAIPVRNQNLEKIKQ